MWRRIGGEQVVPALELHRMTRVVEQRGRCVPRARSHARHCCTQSRGVGVDKQ